jgi:hypothetical protein
MIDYTVHACVEYDELKKLIYYLRDFLLDDDKIVVLLDSDNSTSKVKSLVKQSKLEMGDSLVYGSCPLFPLKDMTRYIRGMCTNPTILSLCADETPTVPLVKQCRTLLVDDPAVDAIGIPRINTYSDLTKEKAMNMYVGSRPQDYLLKERNEHGWHCWPDYQIRLTRNVPYIGYGDDVHAGLTGFKNVRYLPAQPEIALIHVKSVAHQERMLKIYDRAERLNLR